MGQVCLIHHHFLRGPRSRAVQLSFPYFDPESSARSSGHSHRRSDLLWIHQLFQLGPWGISDCGHGKPMGNPWETHGKPMGNPWETHGKCNPCRSHHLRQRQLQHRLGAIFDVPNGSLTKQHDCDSCGLCQAPKSEEAQGGIFLDTITLLSWLQMTRHCKKSESR